MMVPLPSFFLFLMLLLPLLTHSPVVMAIENPSGSCESGTPSTASTFPSGRPERVYLRDCNLTTTTREFWNVFALGPDTPGMAVITPRPQGMTLDVLCSNNTTSTLFEKYELCGEWVYKPNVVHSIEIGDALQMTHMLHEHLVFRAQPPEDDADLWRIDPGFLYEDLYQACDWLLATSNSTTTTFTPQAVEDAQRYCGQVRFDNEQCSEDERGCAVREERVEPTEAAINALSWALNKLYGIAQPPLEEDTGSSSSSLLSYYPTTVIIVILLLIWRMT